MILIDAYYSEMNPNNRESICSRVFERAYEYRISLLAISCFAFAGDFVGGFIIQKPNWAAPVMLATGLMGGFISLAMLSKEIDYRRQENPRV